MNGQGVQRKDAAEGSIFEAFKSYKLLQRLQVIVHKKMSNFTIFVPDDDHKMTLRATQLSQPLVERCIGVVMLERKCVNQHCLGNYHKARCPWLDSRQLCWRATDGHFEHFSLAVLEV